MSKPPQRSFSRSRQSSNHEDYPLPKDTRAIVYSQSLNCRNLGLWLDRFAIYDQKGASWSLSQQTKRRQGAPLNFQSVAPLLDAHAARQRAMLNTSKERKCTVREFVISPDWRTIVGLGATHVLETSLTLHRLYGFPVIPGSGLKGMTRAYAELVLGKDEKDEQFRRVFGSQQEKAGQAGEVVFFDAIPSQPPRLKLDVMNPHYSEYYQGGDISPADYLSPIPVYFLALERTPFLFAVAARRPEANALVDIVDTWLKAGLKELGLGAKTAAGYGYFSEISSQ
jgi:CRISPR-associated protein Cmr6